MGLLAWMGQNEAGGCLNAVYAYFFLHFNRIGQLYAGCAGNSMIFIRSNKFSGCLKRVRAA